LNLVARKIRPGKPGSKKKRKIRKAIYWGKRKKKKIESLWTKKKTGDNYRPQVQEIRLLRQKQISLSFVIGGAGKVSKISELDERKSV